MDDWEREPAHGDEGKADGADPEHVASETDSRLDALAESIGALRRSLPSADVTSRLTSRVDALPDTIAARLGTDAANAALGVRIGSLASAIEQSKLATVAAVDDVAGKLADEPDWVALLAAKIDAVSGSIAERVGTGEVLSDLAELRALVDGLARGIDHTGPEAVAVVEDLDGKVGDLAGKVGDLDDKVSDLDGKVGDVGAKMTALDSKVIALDAKISREFEALRSEEPEWLAPLLAPLLARIDALAETVTASDEASRSERALLRDRMDAIEARLAEMVVALGAAAEPVEEVAVHVAGAAAAVDVLRSAMAHVSSEVAAVGDRLIAHADDSAAVSEQHRVLLNDNTSALVAIARETRSILAKLDDPHDAQLIDEVSAAVARLTAMADKPASPGEPSMSMTAVFDRMEQRDRSLAARLDRLHQATSARGPQPAPPTQAPPSEQVGPALDGLAAATDDLASLVTATGDRIDARLGEVQRQLDELADLADHLENAVESAASPGPTDAAAILALLRAERAMVQSRLDAERLLAAGLPEGPGGLEPA